MNKQKLIISIAAIVGVLSIFFPWVSMPFVGNVNGTSGSWGWVGVALYCISLAVALLGNRATPLDKRQQLIVGIPALLVAVIGIWKIIQFKSSIGGVPSDNPFAEALSKAVSLQIGIFLFVLAGIVIGAIAFAGDKIIKEAKKQ